MVAGPRAELLADVHQGDRAGQVAGAGGVGAVEIGQPVVDHRGGQAQGLEVGIGGGLAAEALDQQVGGAVVAHPDHFGGGFIEREAGAQRPAGHPAGTPAHHLFGERQRFVPAQLAGVEVVEGRQQDRGLDRARRRQGRVGIELGETAVIQHQQEAAHLEILLLGGQGLPALAELGELHPGLEAAQSQAPLGGGHR